MKCVFYEWATQEQIFVNMIWKSTTQDLHERKANIQFILQLIYYSREALAKLESPFQQSWVPAYANTSVI